MQRAGSWQLFTALREWVLEFDRKIWDRQLRSDVELGRLDALAVEALRDRKGGQTEPL